MIMTKDKQNFFKKNPGYWNSRLLIGTPMTGVVRSEWVEARYNQVIPTNWSHAQITQWMSSQIPVRYQVADAENIIAKNFVEGDWEWLLFIESDNVLPPNTLVALNEYMIRKEVPIVGALYFTKSVPPEPMVYRELGKGYYADWKLGDKVWCSGLPFGCTLIHGSIIRELWKTAPEYKLADGKVYRRIFNQPQQTLLGEDGDGYGVITGTSDLNFCRQIKEQDIFTKAGWPEFAKKEHPFLVDTRIFVKHIDLDGVQWPINLPEPFLNREKTLAQCLSANTDWTVPEKKK
jgi:hypothetical protein